MTEGEETLGGPDATAGPPTSAKTERRWLRLQSSHLDPQERRAVLGQLFYEGPERRPYLFRFAILLSLSVVIATFGLAANSTAVIIGAMLVAPLMTPILAFAAALVMGWPRRQGYAILIVVAGAAGAVGLAWLIASVSSSFDLDPLPSEVLARTSPGLPDLAIAIAAGAAGAYVTVRTKGLGALPGVAIAVALVPPLSVLGITLEAGEGELSRGALLLFLTNLAAIVLSASVVFMATGFVPRRRAELEGRRIQLGFGIALVIVIGLAFPLAEHSQTQYQEAKNREQLSAGVETWLGPRDLRIGNVVLDRSGDELDIVIDLVGPDEPPPPETLADAIAAETGLTVNLNLGWVREERSEVRSPG